MCHNYQESCEEAREHHGVISLCEMSAPSDFIYEAWSTYLVLIMAFCHVIYMVLIGIQLLLEPRDKQPLEYHAKQLSANVRSCQRYGGLNRCNVLSMSYQPSWTPYLRIDSNPGVKWHRSWDHMISGLMFFLCRIHRCWRVPYRVSSCHWRIIVCALVMPKFSVPGSLWVTKGIPMKRRQNQWIDLNKKRILTPILFNNGEIRAHAPT